MKERLLRNGRVRRSNGKEYIVLGEMLLVSKHCSRGKKTIGNDQIGAVRDKQTKFQKGNSRAVHDPEEVNSYGVNTRKKCRIRFVNSLKGRLAEGRAERSEDAEIF